MTTNQFRSINFLNQTGDFNYNLNLAVNNSTGYFEFGLSGSSSKLAFKNQYGKIKDANDNIIIGYLANRELNINGSIVSGRETLTIDNTLIYSNIPNTGYNFNYFYLNPIGCSLDYNFSLTGGYTDLFSTITTPKIKNYNIVVDDKNNPFVTKTLTGILVNQNPDLEVKIFSAVATSKTDTYSLGGFPITFNNTGTYLINSSTGIDALVNDSFDALFYTNFGNITKTISISGEVIPLFFLFFDVSPAITGFPNVQTGYDQIFVNTPKDYSLSYGYVSGANVQLSLSYVSGLTGNVTGFLSATGKFNGTLSGYLTGSGYISSYVATGVLFSGGNDFLNNVQYVTDSGFYAQQFKVATGYSKGNYVITGYGLGSGYIYQDVFATGKIRVLVTGNVPYVGGLTVAVNPYPFTGSGIAYNQNNSGFIATGIVDGYFPNFTQLLYTGALTGIILSNTQYSGKNFSFTPPRDAVVVASDPYKIVATGYQSGIGPTGKVSAEFFIDFDQGYYTFVKNFSGITGESRATDEEDIITGNLGILNCNVSQNRKYISYAYDLSGSVTGSAYLSLCDTNSAIPSGFIATATTTGNVELYVITGQCDEPGKILDQALPKFVVIKPTGTYELKTKTLETGINYSFDQESYYLLNDTGIRTHIFGVGSGYFSNIVGTCQNSGRWEHLFSANDIVVEQNISDYIVNNINFDLITLEDDGQNYLSEVNFRVTGLAEKFNLNLTQNNIPIQLSPSRDIFYNLILSKKIDTNAYSGFYESKFTAIQSDIVFCTGLTQGDYKARVKYVNVSTAPTGKSLCRVPIQIANIVDKNYYNKLNIDIFTGYMSFNVDNFRYNGSGFNQNANIFYTKTGIYGHNFLTGTGYTDNYIAALTTAPYSDENANYTPDNKIIEAIEIAKTLNWNSSGVRNINIITNHISLTGYTKNQFLQYIGNIYTYSGIIFNTLNCQSQNSSSFDNTSEFLKDIAKFGGGTYYTCSKNSSNVDSFADYNSLIPLDKEKMYIVCDKNYPIVSGKDTRAGQIGIDLPPPNSPQSLPSFSGNLPGPGSSVPIPIFAIPGIVIPDKNVVNGGAVGGGSMGGGNGTTSNSATCDYRDEKLQVQITSIEWIVPPTVSSTAFNKCKCTQPGRLKIKGTLYNPNCIPISQNVNVKAQIKRAGGGPGAGATLSTSYAEKQVDVNAGSVIDKENNQGSFFKGMGEGPKTEFKDLGVKFGTTEFNYLNTTPIGSAGNGNFSNLSAGGGIKFKPLDIKSSDYGKNPLSVGGGTYTSPNPLTVGSQTQFNPLGK